MTEKTITQDLTDGWTVTVAIIEKSVFGVVAYHAKCLSCGWRCHMEAHDLETVALAHGKAHVCAFPR